MKGKRGKKSSTLLPITWAGLLFFLLLVLHLLNLLKNGSLRRKMTTINKDGGTIYRLLLNAGFSEKHAQWITAQSAHETANFSSYIYRINFNAFGMKYMKQATALGEKNGYAYYNDYSESVQDYNRLWKSWVFVSSLNIESFVLFLKNKRYFEAPMTEYLAGMKHFLKLYFPGGELDKSLIIPGAGGTW